MAAVVRVPTNISILRANLFPKYSYYIFHINYRNFKQNIWITLSDKHMKCIKKFFLLTSPKTEFYGSFHCMWVVAFVLTEKKNFSRYT